MKKGELSNNWTAALNVLACAAAGTGWPIYIRNFCSEQDISPLEALDQVICKQKYHLIDILSLKNPWAA
uniref:Transposase n=1 Tax=Syphacia muris TaxID=451379 RepID=A0A0N5AT86_9BILA